MKEIYCEVGIEGVCVCERERERGKGGINIGGERGEGHTCIWRSRERERVY